VEAGDAYALSWQARGGAPALALRIPALRFESNGLKIPETQDGPRNVVLLAEAPSGLATVTLYRDDSQLDDAAHVSLYGKPRRDDSEPHFVHLEEEPGAWRLLGFECPARMGDYPDLWREAALGCSKPAGFFARHMPSVFGPPRSPIDVRPAAGRSGECRMTFLYRGRPAQVRARGKCFTEPTLDALDASARLLARMERERTAPLAPERLAHLDSATALCERMRDLDTCRYTLRFVNVELQAQPAAALKSIIRIVETGSLGRGAERVAWLRTAQQALGDAGARDSRESVHVHVLVLEHGAPNASERLDSLSVLMRLAPQVLQPSDPLTSRTVAILKAERLHPTEEPMRLAALEALAAKSGGR
jgi:hypothetical protein